jgi:alpha-galactosidase
MKPIVFHRDRRLFVLNLRSSIYAFRVLDSGGLVHLGWSPAPEEAGERLILGENDYKDPDRGWDEQMRRYEFPARGDLTIHDASIHAVFGEPPREVKEGEAFHGEVRDLRLRYGSHEILADAEPALAPRHGRPPRVNTPRQTLAVHLRDESYELEVVLFYRVTPEHDILERWVEIRNGTRKPVRVERLDFASATLPNGTTTLTYPAGQWAREFLPVTRDLTQGLFVLEQRGLNTGHFHNPFFLLHAPGAATEESGTVWFGALAYSGNWNLRFDYRQSTAIRVSGGYGQTDFAIDLNPGETHRTPAMVLGCCAEGLGGASRRMHRFARERVLPGYGRDEVRPVLYNSWEATYFDVSESNQIELARKAASIGVELFCVDDGWFTGRADDRAGLGDWTPDPEKFPHGLKPLSAEVRRLGMKFGLWVEPEMVNPDSDLYRAHPDWVLHQPGRARRESRNQLILDFGRPEVFEYLFGALDRLVHESGVDFFKWDMNRYVMDTGSVAGRGIWRAHVEALYGLMDRLRERHPHLEIQSCSGGGGRIDFGILARCDQAWASDNTDAHERARIQDGFSLAYPARAMECWVTHEKNHQTGRITSLNLRFDAAMRGTLGIGASLDQLSEEELADYRRKIGFYKQLRPVVQEGDLYRLAVAARGGVSTWLFVTPDRTRAVYSTIVLEHPLGVYRAPAVLRGLKTGAVYRVSDEQQKEIGRYSGAQLMSLGLPGDTASGGMGCVIRSRTVLLEEIDAEN